MKLELLNDDREPTKYVNAMKYSIVEKKIMQIIKPLDANISGIKRRL